MVRAVAGGAIVDVHVIPRAARSEPAGLRGGRLLVRLTAPPVDGAANAALIATLAATLGVPRRQVSIVAGDRSRDKQVRVEGLQPADVLSRLGLA
jgi:uncharacterized protein